MFFFSRLEIAFFYLEKLFSTDTCNAVYAEFTALNSSRIRLLNISQITSVS